VLGLDLSTRAAAAVIVPANWNGDWQLVRRLVVGLPLDRQASDHDRAMRTRHLSDQLTSFAVDYRVGSAFFESYGYGMRTAAHTLGELGGVVRLSMLEAGLVIRTANMSSARKLLLGKIPRGPGAAKAAVYRALRAAGMPFGPSKTALDEADAFVCANWGLSEQGCYCFVQADPKTR
jgi:hypothetical protein